MPFAAQYAAAVAGVILPIQQAEFDIPITLEAQPDLADIPSFYQRGNGNFWVALDDESVIGTIGLLDIGGAQVALRKMFVKASHRGAGRGVARTLLHTSIDWARSHGVERIFLGTTAKFVAAHRFYEKHGFAAVRREELPSSFPAMTVDTKFYVLDSERAKRGSCE
jgi:GNAT superfamily N-acetyltransferase